MMQPILIAAPPRSGTSMIAGLLAAHGVWTGRCGGPGRINAKGSIENLAFKALLKAQLVSRGHEPNAWPPMPEYQSDDDLADRVSEIAPATGPWLVKESKLLLLWQEWSEAFPQALWVLPRRDIDFIVASMERSIEKRGDYRSFAVFLRGLQDTIASRVARFVDVDADRVAEGSESVQRELIEACGLEFDARSAADWVDQRLWHG